MQLHPTTPAQETPDVAPLVPAVRPAPMPKLQRRLLWAAIAVVLMVLLVLTPPLVNANRYQRQIARSMSESLGRPVHLDNVSLHLLPVPGFTLQNLVVSEDPAFGAEPTIRANTVEATLRISSLWHRPVEFSTVRFIEPSVNLVRNADGRWNLNDVLLHASRVNTAPTNQRKAGPTPRFPYIEATDGRVNVKLGDTKLPFSLTESDFALWLPSPRQWRVRLLGHPSRTDTNITESGTLRVEGELRRAGSAPEVPVNFQGSWQNVPLGEASRILTGEDMGWRGSLNLDVALSGMLGEARLASKLTLGGLRRADFFPSRPLDLQITCGAGLTVRPVSLRELQCAMPDEAPEPFTLRAPRVDLQHPRQTEVAVDAPAVPVRWALLWAALYSPRVAINLRPGGTLDVFLAHSVSSRIPPRARTKRRGIATAAVGAPAWTGQVRLSLPAVQTSSSEASAGVPTVLTWQVGPSPDTPKGLALTLQPAQVRLGPDGTINLTGKVSGSGYSLGVAGSAPAAAILVPARYLPQLGDGLDQVLPFPPTGLNPVPLAFTCTRSWASAQSCTGARANTASRVPASLATMANRRSRTPALLTPRNLSPLERSPFSVPRPAPKQ